MNNERINVLAVMDEAAQELRNRGPRGVSTFARDLFAARAAVAELVAMSAALLKVTDFDLLEWQDLNNALHRVKGGAK